MTAFVWEPDDRAVATANVTRLARSLGLDSYPELLDWSRRHPADYWDAVVRDLGIVFSRAYDRTVDESAGPAWPTWFIGGELNIASQCVVLPSEKAPEGRAVWWEDESRCRRSLTFSELRDECARVAALLSEIGVEPGDRVALVMPMCPEAVVSLYATAWIGAVCVPVFSGFGAAAISERLAASGAVAVLTVSSSVRRGRPVGLADEVRSAIDRLDQALHVVVAGRDDGRLEEGEVDWSATPSRPIGDPLAVAAEHPVLVAYTSGTTGRPKGVVHVHGGFLVKVASEVAYFTDVHRDDQMLWVTDMGWLMGPWKMIGCHSALAGVVLIEGALDVPDADRLWRVCEAAEVTHLGLAPTVIRSLVGRSTVPRRTADLSRLRILGSTGEPWDDDSYRWFAREVGGGQCPIINLSGGTEVGACLLGQPPTIPTKVGSVGGPAPGLHVDVVDAAGKSLHGPVGELVCRNTWPAQTRGFLDDPERYLDTYWRRFPDVWVHGDWASVDADGYWFLHGRSDDTMNVAGKRVGPAEVEAAATSVTGVRECAAVGIPDERLGTRVCCVCVVDEAATAHVADDVSAALARELGRPFAHAVTYVVPSLPKTASGKIVRRLIRDLLAGDPIGDISTLERPAAVAELQRALGPTSSA